MMEENTSTGSRTSEASMVEEGKTMAMVAYLFLIGLIIAFVINNDKKNAFTAYHIRQMLGLSVSGIALFVVGIIPILGWLIAILGNITLLILWIIGFVAALNGKEKPVPILGEKYQEWFKSV